MIFFNSGITAEAAVAGNLRMRRSLENPGDFWGRNEEVTENSVVSTEIDFDRDSTSVKYGEPNLESESDIKKSTTSTWEAASESVNSIKLNLEQVTSTENFIKSKTEQALSPVNSTSFQQHPVLNEVNFLETVLAQNNTKIFPKKDPRSVESARPSAGCRAERSMSGLVLIVCNIFLYQTVF